MMQHPNYRDLAVHNHTAPKSAAGFKVGEWVDFYSNDNGDKLYGKVIKNDGRTITFQTENGKKTTQKIGAV